METSIFGSEFVAARLSVEMNDSIRYKLRMMGVPIDEPTNGLCDNKSVVTNATLPHSTLSKKHHSNAYHRCREAVAAETIQVAKEGTLNNLADIFTKVILIIITNYISIECLY